MKKKAGFVVAASAVALLGLTPVAFATGIDKSAEGVGFGGANGNNLSTPATGCNNDATVGGAGGAVKDVTGAAAGAASGMGDSKSKSWANDEDNRACHTVSDAGDGH